LVKDARQIVHIDGDVVAVVLEVYEVIDPGSETLALLVDVDGLRKTRQKG
jgi:hypothetical protein